MLVENYKEIFPTEKAWNQYDQEINTIMKQVSELPDEEDYGVHGGHFKHGGHIQASTIGATWC